MTTYSDSLLHLPLACEESRDPVRRQEALLALGRRAMAQPAPLALMQDAALLLAGMLGTEQCLVAELATPATELILHLTSLGPASEQSGTVVERVANKPTRSLAGFVLQGGQPLILADLKYEPSFQDSLLEQYEIRTALAVPLGLPGRPLGALAACSSGPCCFTPEDVVFAETVAQMVTTTVAWGHAEQRLAAQQRQSQKLLETVKAMVLVLDAEGRILEANRVCEEVSGFTFEEIRGRRLWNAFPLAQELELFQTVFPQLLQEGNPVQYESSLLTKGSQWRQVAWSCSAIRDDSGSIDSILVTGIDLTDQRRSEERTLEVAAAAEMAWQSVSPSSATEPAETAAPQPPADEAADVQTPAEVGERRRRKRRMYPYEQLIAPVVNGDLPNPRDFYHVLCRDISAGGFSYLSAGPPAFPSLVVALGTAPALTYLHATVRHVTQIQYQGKPAHVVGCAYTGRVFY